MVDIEKQLKALSSKFSKSDTLVIILAAGHGKRIKSSTSKMLHTIWGIPTIERVRRAASNGIKDTNMTIVVGIKPLDVANAIGKVDNTTFVYQKEQRGTGHAVQVALEGSKLQGIKYCYVIYADMGLIDSNTLSEFHNTFMEAKSDMIIMTSNYNGSTENNYYGRILRVRGLTFDGKISKYKKAKSDVIGITEHKDILAMKEDEKLFIDYKDERFSYDKDELLNNIVEYNAGIYGFKTKYLEKLLFNIKPNNAQKELYLTDVISLFVKEGLSITTYTPKYDKVVLGFNDKTVLKEMEDIARNDVYEKLKNIITIADAYDFFIADDVVNQILSTDKDDKPLDIYIGKGAYIGAGVKMNYGATIQNNAKIKGNVKLGLNNNIGANVYLSCMEHQSLVLGNNVKIYSGNQVRGNVVIGNNTTLERGVNITGSDEHPTKIGADVLIKGESYLYGCKVDDGLYIEHCIFYYSKIVKKIDPKTGEVIKARFIMPEPEGLDIVKKINDK